MKVCAAVEHGWDELVRQFPARTVFHGLGWLKAVANLNPMSLTVEAARGFALGAPDGGDVVRSLVSSAVVAVLGIGAASRAYRTSSAA